MPRGIGRVGKTSVYAELDWHGDRVMDNLSVHLQKGLIKVTLMYKEALIDILQKRPWGSVRVNPRFRLREKRTGRFKMTPPGGRIAVRYSPPGTAPYKQTQNLVNSIKHEIMINKRGHVYRGVVFTEVPYAPTLEFGGAFQGWKNGKVYTKYWITNWGSKAKTIAPRPVWFPLFGRLQQAMVKTFWTMPITAIYSRRNLVPKGLEVDL